MPNIHTQTPKHAGARTAASARRDLFASLVADHQRVKKALRDFKKLDPERDSAACEALVRRTVLDLQLHTTLEEELLYPAARSALRETDLLDEAEVEHESAHQLMDQLMAMSIGDDKYAARFTVLCEYVLHHVKEEEKELFPQIEKARLDWDSLEAEAAERRAVLKADLGLDDTGAGPPAARGSANAERYDDEASVGSDDATPPPAMRAQRDAPRTAARDDKPATGITSGGAAGSRKI